MQTAADSMSAASGSLVLNILFIFLLSSFNFALRRPWRALSTIWIIFMASIVVIFLTTSDYIETRVEKNN